MHAYSIHANACLQCNKLKNKNPAFKKLLKSLKVETANHTWHAIHECIMHHQLPCMPVGVCARVSAEMYATVFSDIYNAVLYIYLWSVIFQFFLQLFMKHCNYLNMLK